MRGTGAAWSWSAQLDWDAGRPMCIRCSSRPAAIGLARGRFDGPDRARGGELALDGVAAASARGVFDAPPARWTPRGRADRSPTVPHRPALAGAAAGAGECAQFAPRGRADLRAELRQDRLETLDVGTARGGLRPRVAAGGEAAGGSGGMARRVLAFGGWARALVLARPGEPPCRLGRALGEARARGLRARRGARARRAAPAGRAHPLDGALVLGISPSRLVRCRLGGAGVVPGEPVSMPLLTEALGLPAWRG